MELRKKELHMLRKKSEAQNQITFDEDFNVPDHKADIGQMIQKKGEVEIDQVQVSEGKAVIQGAAGLSAFICGRQSGTDGFESGGETSDRGDVASGRGGEAGIKSA